LGEELLSLLETLANRHVPQNNGEDYVIALMDLGNRGFSREFVSVLSDGSYLSALAHAASLHAGPPELRNLTRVIRPKAVRNQGFESKP
jgi:hypothetical protein